MHGITIVIIAVVSWLFNHESEKAFHRAKVSELALQNERNSLALKVTKKTKELQHEQAEKIAQIYKFAEFGKMTSGIVHDLSNSVMMVTANLDQVEKLALQVKPLTDDLAKARIGASQLEKFILATRSRLNNCEVISEFSLNNEMIHVLEIMTHKAKESNVALNLIVDDEIKMYGSATKFHQFMSNLISNAIDAYDGVLLKNKPVTIKMKKRKQHIEISVIDFGKGIAKQNLSQIFKPFFSTKQTDKSSGLGLSITKDIVVKDFNGHISVESQLEKGTQFSLRLPISERSKINI